MDLSFAEIVAAEFRPEVALTWSLKSLTHAVATFPVSTVTVEVSFEQRERNGPWHVSFEVHRGEPEERVLYLAFHIFSGVFQAVREFVETREPEVVVFITKRDELAGIYETYLKRDKAEMEQLGYALEGPDRVEPYTQFTLRRARPSGWKP